jgi:hypothetical protein
MNEAAISSLPLAGMHHLALFALLVIIWVRREAAGRALAVYFAAAFGSAAAVMLVHRGTRLEGAAAAALCALWTHEAVTTGLDLAFAATPRPRLVLMAAAAGFAMAYPGYSGDLPSFVFSPIGVILPPTLLAACALLNASSGRPRLALHWTVAVLGLAVSVAGVAARDWRSVVLLLTSLYSVPLLLGRGRTRRGPEARTPSSVREIRQRMYSRRSILPGPRDSRRRDRAVRVRRR